MKEIKKYDSHLTIGRITTRDDTRKILTLAGAPLKYVSSHKIAQRCH